MRNRLTTSEASDGAIMEASEICWLKIYDWLWNKIVPVIMSLVSFVSQLLGSSLKFTAGPQPRVVKDTLHFSFLFLLLWQ